MGWLFHVRITPACAGKSRCWRLHGRHGWDHPRVCGEKNRVQYQPARLRGSPPRVRGKAFIPVNRM